MDWLTSWDEARRYKGRARIFVFVSAWVISITVALVLLGSGLGDVLVSVAFACGCVARNADARARSPTGDARAVKEAQPQVSGPLEERREDCCSRWAQGSSQKPQQGSLVWDLSSLG
jgi:hypothetical protein